jgi:protein SCO1/2
MKVFSTKNTIIAMGLLAILVSFSACSDSKKEQKNNEPLPEMSVYQLPSEWTSQDSETIKLEELRGDVVVMVMIYTSCKAACPRLVADMRSIESKVGKSGVKYVLISIDPETDTPQKLKAFAIENQMAEDHWLFLRSPEEQVRELANVLAVKYKEISPVDFSHSNIISVFDRDGVLAHQQEGLGVDNAQTVQAISDLIEN